MVNWQLCKKSIHWPVSDNCRAGLGVQLIQATCRGEGPSLTSYYFRFSFINCTLKSIFKRNWIWLLLLVKVQLFQKDISQKISRELRFWPWLNIQLFREKLSEKVHATIRKGIVGGFECTVLQRNFAMLCLWLLKESNQSRLDIYSRYRNSVLIISHIIFRDCRVHILSDNLSRNNCILFILMV